MPPYLQENPLTEMNPNVQGLLEEVNRSRIVKNPEVGTWVSSVVNSFVQAMKAPIEASERQTVLIHHSTVEKINHLVQFHNGEVKEHASSLLKKERINYIFLSDNSPDDACTIVS
jgi:hypothetical protein